MLDLISIYNAFDVEEPLPADDNIRYVDLTKVRGGSNISRKLLQRIRNASARGNASHHLVMGHTKCGKTTELNRTVRLLEEEGYVTVFFDVAEAATRTFEYTTVLLIMAGQIVEQLAKRKPRGIKIKGTSAEQLVEFLREREVTSGGHISGEATGKVEGKTSLLTRLLGELGVGFELRGGFQRSRDITVKIEADTHGFLDAIKTLVRDANERVISAGYKGLVVVCDGCDKLAITATDENGNSYDLQRAMFVDHAEDLCDVPCHVIYTVPISIPVNFGDLWEQGVVFVPAVPVSEMPGLDDNHAVEGRRLLKEVISRRLEQQQTTVQELFSDSSLLNNLIDVSGGHISDLLLLVREAVLEAQTDEEEQLTDLHIGRSILSRALEYTRLIEPRYLQTLVTIDEYKTAPSNSDEYRDLIFKRLALEYVCGSRNYVALHPLVAASDTYRRLRNPQSL